MDGEAPGPACVYRVRDKSGRLLHVGAGQDPFDFFVRHEHEAWWVQATNVDVAHFATLAGAEAVVPGAVSVEGPVYGGCTPTPRSG